MRFTLTYQGRLPSSSDAASKHRIRTELHPQLKELWNTHSALADKAKWISTLPNSGEPNDQEGLLIEAIDSHHYASLVHPELRLYAELDILVLRPEAPGEVISHSGDIDNQLKTLFDALRKPADANEVSKSWVPSIDERPLHCLLADDKLITRVNVETDRLLIPSASPKEVAVTIRVTVKGTTATWGNIGLIS